MHTHVIRPSLVTSISTSKRACERGTATFSRLEQREKKRQRPDEYRFNLWDQDGRIHVRRYAGKQCLPECVIERHSGLTPGVMAWSIPGAIFQQDSARPHVSKTVRDFCSAQHMKLFPWHAYLPDISSIEHVWVLVGWRLPRYPHPAASKDELLLRIQEIWNSLPQVVIQNLFDSIPRRYQHLLQRVVATPNTDLGHLK
ncbi:transposable element Tc1 transposase [Trichonephila clavipes]|nr:transposable element Tc1 transposase [Trichonephila clavipes]